ncbi:unnamed protein product [Auanema sp. JU1783]|nr:unnamed protein product [Auanema sp. JU1783]
MSSDDSECTWIQAFCSMYGNEFLTEVDESFIADQFNLTGLSDIVPDFRKALKIILDYDDSSDKSSMQLVSSAEFSRNCQMLYGVVHARFIMSTVGLEKMYDKVINKEFGKCPRYLCDSTPLIPTGIHDDPGLDTVKLFCPCCNEIYSPIPSKHRLLDGAYFGTSFAQMLLMAYPLLRKKHKIEFIPRLYGFRIHPSVK